MSNRQYDILKFVALIALPAVAALYSSLSGIWGWPRGQETLATIAAIQVCLGVLLKWASDRYDKDGDGEYDKEYVGVFKVGHEEDGYTYKLELELEPDDLQAMESFSLRVNHE